MFSRWKKRNAKTRKDRKCVENPCQSEKGGLAWDKQLVWPMAVDERFVAPARNSRGEERMRLFRARGLTELGQVASGSAMQGLWLGNRKDLR